MNIKVVMPYLVACLFMSACAGPEVGKRDNGIRTEARNPIVYSRVNEKSDGPSLLGPIRTLREQQVDVVAVLVQGIRQYGYAIDTSNGLVPAPQEQAEKVVHLKGVSGEQAINVLITFVETLPEEDRVAIRSSLASQVLAASDANCSVYVQSMRGAQVTTRLITDMATTIFAGQGALAKYDSTAKRMSTFAGMSSAIGANIDRDVYAQEAAELIADSIVKQRATMEIGLRRHFGDDYKSWPIGSVLADVSSYHQECSATRGLSRMRDTIIAREQTVHAVRRAAAEVEKKGGSGKEVLAVMTGGLGDDADYLPPDAYVSPVLAAGREDLDGLLKTAAACGDAAKAARPADDNKLKALDACKKGETGSLLADLVAVYVNGLLPSAHPDLTKPAPVAAAAGTSPAADGAAPADPYDLALAQSTEKAEARVLEIAYGRRRMASVIDVQAPNVDWPTLKKSLEANMDSKDPLLPPIEASIGEKVGLKGAALADLVKTAWKSAYKTAIAG